MRLLVTMLLGCALTIAGAVQAQPEGADRTIKHREILRMGLYPPDVIMRHQQRLGITGEQRETISAAVSKFQTDVAGLQWELQNEQQLLQQSLSGYRIETDEALARVEQVLQLESQFKLLHFELLIAIKNTLTEEQIDMIRARLRKLQQERGAASG